MDEDVQERVGRNGSEWVAARAGVLVVLGDDLVRGVARAGYVRRTTDPTDARARLVQITARGHKTIPIAAAAVAAVEAE